MIRRLETAEVDPDTISAGPIRLTPSRHEVIVGGAPIMLTATEFRLLNTIMSAGGRVLSRSQLLDRVFGADVVVTDRTIDVHITALRKKLGDASAWVQTVRGVGYTFRRP